MIDLTQVAAAFILPRQAVLDHLTNLLYGITTAFLLLTTITVLLRVWVRTRMVKCWGKDDWMMLAAQIIFMAQCGIIFFFAHLQSKVTDANIFTAFGELYVYLTITESLYLISSLFLKFSLALFFLRYLTERWAQIVIWTSIAVYIIYTCFAFFVLLFHCGVPTKENLTMKTISDTCGIGNHILVPLNISWSSVNTLTDCIFALLPIHFIRKSRMTTSTKFSVAGIMVLAVLGSGASIGRTLYTGELQNPKNIWKTWTVFILWSVLEPGIGITTANLATLRPLVRACGYRLKMGTSNQEYSSGSGSGRTSEQFSKPVVRQIQEIKGTRQSRFDSIELLDDDLEFVTAKTFESDIERGEKAIH